MNINVSSVTSHFPNPQDGFTTTTSGSVSSSAATVGLNSTGDYSSGDIVVLIIDPADPDKKQVFVGKIDISGSQVTDVVWVGGTNQAHSSGAAVVDYYDAAHVKMTTKGILVHANQDGTLKSGAVHNDGVLASNVVTTDKILEGAVTTSKVTASGCDLTHSTTQSIANNTIQAVVFNNEVLDTDSYHSTVTNTSRITVPTAGKYSFKANVAFATNNTGIRFTWFVRNGVTTERFGATSSNSVQGDVTFHNISMDLNLAAGHYIEVYVFQNSGGALNLNGDASAVGGTKFSCTRIGT